MGTAIMWSFTSTFFASAGRHVGSAIVNRTRLLVAVVLVIVTHWLLIGQPFPLAAEPFRWGWLSLSGLIGLVVGDAMLFQALVLLGPRLAMLVLSLTPVFSTLLGWSLLGERLLPVQFLGILLTVGGAALVVSARRYEDGQPETARRNYIIGLMLGLGAALGQATGLLTSRSGPHW